MVEWRGKRRLKLVNGLHLFLNTNSVPSEGRARLAPVGNAATAGTIFANAGTAGSGKYPELFQDEAAKNSSATTPGYTSVVDRTRAQVETAPPRPRNWWGLGLQSRATAPHERDALEFAPKQMADGAVVR